MKRSQAIELLNKKPELIPLTEDQKKAFTFFWNEKKDYTSRQQLVSSIPSTWGNRNRYRDECLIPESSDWYMFNQIMNDDDTLF